MATLLVELGTGCHSGVRQDPDLNSGQDADCAHAKLFHIDRAEIDSVSFPRRLRTKWKRLSLRVQKGNPRNIVCALRIDNARAELSLTMFQGNCSNLRNSVSSSHTNATQVVMNIEKSDVYMLRIQAANETDESDFSLRCAWQ